MVCWNETTAGGRKKKTRKQKDKERTQKSMRNKQSKTEGEREIKRGDGRLQQLLQETSYRLFYNNNPNISLFVFNYVVPGDRVHMNLYLNGNA